MKLSETCQQRRLAWAATRRIPAMLGGCIAALALAACSQQGAAPSATASGDQPAAASASTTGPSRLVFAMARNAGPLNPHLYSPNQMYAQEMVYEPLVRYTKEGKVIPWLAESWEISEDGKAYTFKLRTDVKFSDGSAFDAEAVKKNIDAVLANRKRHEWMDLMNQLEGAEVVDKHTVKFNLKSAYYPFLAEMSLVRPLRFMAPSAIPDSGSTAEGIKAPIGTGPFMVTELKDGEYDLFARNPHYWGNKPAFDEVMFKVIPDTNSRALALESGEADIVFGDGPITPDAYNRFKGMTDQFAVSASQGFATRLFVINSKRFPTNDLAVRKAINHATNKDAIIKNVLFDIEPRADMLFTSNTPYANINLKPYEYNAEGAAQLLEEAGWKLPAGGKVREKDGKKLAIDLSFIGNEGKDRAIAEVLQADLGKVGIQVNLVGEEAAAKLAREKDGNFHMIAHASFGPPYDPQSFLSQARKPSHGDYRGQEGIPMKAELDQKITQVLQETDEAKRVELWTWILTTLHEQAVYLPISSRNLIEVHNINKVGNVGFGATVSEYPIWAMQPVQKK